MTLNGESRTMGQHEQGGRGGKPERKSSLRPPPLPRRDSQRAAALREALPDYTHHVSSPEQRMRHDGRSALHSIVGFVELLESEALGSMSMEQQLSLAHIKGSAARLFELLESSIDVAQSGQPLPEGSLVPVCLARVVETTVRCMVREQPTPGLLFEGPLEGERVGVLSDPDVLSRLVRMLVQAIAGEHEALGVWLSHTDLHAILTVGVVLYGDESITRTMPGVQVELVDLHSLARLLNNRDYLRLKRCEALVARQRGHLLVSPDLSRVRVVLPKHAG